MDILKGLTLVAALFAGGISPALAQNGFPGDRRPVHHRVSHVHVSHVHSAIYDTVIPTAGGGGCTASGGPACSSACTGSGPCAPPDSW